MKLSIFLMIVAFAAVNATPFKRCSEQRFRTAITGAGGKTMPPVAVPCQKAVYDALCHECGDDIGCFWSKGPKIAPTLSECQHHKTGRNLRSLVGSSTRCNEKSFQEAIAKVPATGVALGCQRAVYNALCDTCGSSTKCYMEKGPSIAKSTPLCRPREVTTYDMEDEEEQVGGRWGRVCATAACLFIEHASPPREPYRPGASSGDAPIVRGRADMMEDGDESVGNRWGRVCATAACLFIEHASPPREPYRPGPSNGDAPIHRGRADMMEDGDEYVGGNRWGRVCATAACLFIDGLNPPREPYRPGASNGNPPIHRPFRGADMMEDGDENVGVKNLGRLACEETWGRNCGYLHYYKPNGKIDFNSPHYSSWRGDHPIKSEGGFPYDELIGHYKLPHHDPDTGKHHDPKGWPGHDMMEDGDVNNVGGYMHNGKYYYDGQAANSNYHPGGGFHHNGNSYPSGTYMDEDDESVGFGDERPPHTRAHRPTSKSVGDWINFRL